MAFNRGAFKSGGAFRLGIGGGAFASKGGIATPADLAGLAVWLRSDVGVTLNGSTVSAWADQSGNGRGVSQATEAKQPTYATNQINGYQSLQWDANGKALSWTPWAQSTSQTVYIVYKANGGGGDQLLLQRSIVSDIGPNVYASANFDGDPDEPGIYYDQESPSVFHDYGSAPAAGWHLLTAKWVMASTSYLAVDNAAFVTTSLAVSEVSNWTSIGLDSTHYFRGELAEVVITSQNISDNDHAEIKANYFRPRYAIW